MNDPKKCKKLFESSLVKLKTHIPYHTILEIRPTNVIVTWYIIFYSNRQ